MSNEKNLIYLALGVSFGALATACYGAFKMVKAARTLNAKIDDLSSGIDIDIPDAVVSAAVEKAIDRMAGKAAADARDDVRREFSSEIRSEVKSAVSKEKEALRSEIKDEIKKHIGYIDISDVKDEVIKDAKLEVSDRLSRELDGIKEEYNKHLNDVKDIYSSIAKSMESAAV